MKPPRSWIARAISHILIILIAVFSFSSVGNVREFIHQYHVGWTGTVLAIGFGVIVFVSAYIAATTPSNRTKKIAITVGTIFGLASGFFQASLYIDGGADWLIAGALSFIPIIVGEVGIALLESNYSKDATDTLADVLYRQVAELQSELERVQLENRKLLDGQVAAAQHVQLAGESFELAQTRSNESLDRLTNALNQSRSEAELLRTELEKSRKVQDKLELDRERLQEDLKKSNDRLDGLNTLARKMNPDEVLSRLPEAARGKVQTMLGIVEGGAIRKASDLTEHGMNKADAYQVWPIAEAALLIYENGDGTFHARRA